jgi:hypothetical protein
MHARVGGEMEGEALEVDTGRIVATSSPVRCRLHQLWKVGKLHCGQPEGIHSSIKDRPGSTIVVVSQPLRTEVIFNNCPGSMMDFRTGILSTFAFGSWDIPGVMIGRINERHGDMQDCLKEY